MNELSRSQFPQHGWIFYQPQTQWHAPMPMANSFDAQVKNIIKHRLANNAVTSKFKLATDEYTVGNELENFTRLRLGMPMNDPASFQRPSRLIPQSVVGAVAGVKKIAAGAALLMEWEESQEPPVIPLVSNERAEICVGCPRNTPGDLTKWFTQPIAELLRKKLARLHSMNLTTFHDEKLFVCSACLCPLKLKVHTPWGLILKHLTTEARSELWDKCWITK